MSRLRVQAIQEAVTEKHEDDVMNVFHFQTAAAPTSLQFEAIDDALAAFYTTLAPYINSSVRDEVRLRYFDLADASPRSPVHEVTMNTSAHSTSRMPSEVSVVLSYRAELLSGANRARRRGRLYIGPLSTGANDTVTGRPSDGVIGAIMSAGEGLRDATTGVDLLDTRWQVYSTTDDLMHDVRHISVDNSYDIQRRRGVDPSVVQHLDLDGPP